MDVQLALNVNVLVEGPCGGPPLFSVTRLGQDLFQVDERGDISELTADPKGEDGSFGLPCEQFFP